MCTDSVVDRHETKHAAAVLMPLVATLTEFSMVLVVY